MIILYNVRYRNKRCRQIYVKNGKMYLDAKCQVEADPKHVSGADQYIHFGRYIFNEDHLGEKSYLDTHRLIFRRPIEGVLTQSR